MKNINYLNVGDKNKEIVTRRSLSFVQKEKECTKPKHLSGIGLRQQFFNARRESYLNSGYNFRRQKLVNITEENRKLYIRINSQKSQYSRQQMRKSYEASASHSKRLSQSKFSRKSSSHSSLRSSQTKSKHPKQKIKQSYRIYTVPVQKLKRQELLRFNSIFKTQISNFKPNTTNNRYKKSVNFDKSFNTDIRITLPSVIKTPKHNQKVRARSLLRSSKDGTLLHAIAQEMFGKKKCPNSYYI